MVEKLITTEYLHLDNSEFADWEMALGDEYRFSRTAEKLHYRLNEVSVDIEIDPNTGQYVILEIRCNGQTLVPK